MSTIEPRRHEDPVGADVGAELDRLTLVQALHDFDVANARVVDLTQRLITTSRELANMREQFTAQQREFEELRSAHESMQRSRAYKLANRIFAIRKAL